MDEVGEGWPWQKEGAAGQTNRPGPLQGAVCPPQELGRPLPTPRGAARLPSTLSSVSLNTCYVSPATYNPPHCGLQDSVRQHLEKRRFPGDSLKALGSGWWWGAVGGGGVPWAGPREHGGGGTSDPHAAPQLGCTPQTPGIAVRSQEGHVVSKTGGRGGGPLAAATCVWAGSLGPGLGWP